MEVALRVPGILQQPVVRPRRPDLCSRLELTEEADEGGVTEARENRGGGLGLSILPGEPYS